MAVDDSDKKSRAILDSKVEKGKEFQQFQEAQGQLLNIQAEQRNNLNQQRVVSSMEAQNNQTLAQAAEILAASGGGAAGGVVAAQQSNKITPGTQAVLNKFGIGKPGKKTVSTTSQSQSPQRVSVTNNTTTNNNIQITQPQIPMSAPVIPMRAGDDTAKFRAWISNAFAKQNEAAGIREKEYQRREWSLTRSANKMIRKMGDLGKAFAETMSPKKLGNILGDQFKVIMFMLGFQYLASNFGKVLEKVDQIANFFTKDFGTTIKEFIGGNKDETLIQSFTGLFSNLADRISDKFSILLETRGKAIKEIEFPKLDLGKMDMGGIISALGGYLGDVISTAFTGSKGLVKSTLRSVKESGKLSSLEHYDDDYSHTQDATKLIKHGKDVSMGDAVMADKNFQKNFKMAASDYNSLGGLSNNVGSSVKQGQYLSNLFENAKNGQPVNLNQFIHGFSALRKTAFRHNGALVPLSTIYYICDYLNIPEEKENVVSLCNKVPVRYIVIDKNQGDLEAENAGTFTGSFVSGYAKSKVTSTIAGGTASWGGAIAQAWDKGNYFEAMDHLVWGWAGSEMRAAHHAKAAATRGLTVDKKKLKMVKVGDDSYPEDKYPSARGKDNNPIVDRNGNIYYELTPRAIKYIETKASEKSGTKTSLDSDTAAGIQELANYMRKYTGGDSGLSKEFNDKLITAANIDREHNEAMKAYEEEHADDRWGKFSSNVSNAVSSVTDKVQNTIDSAANTVGISTPIRKEDTKRNAIYIMNRLTKELGLTKEQAAGLVGNLMGESNLNPAAVSPNRKARGIAQWLGDRREAFKSKYGKEPNEASLEEQVDFLISELKTSHGAYINRAKKSGSTNVKELSDLATGYFEFSVGVEGIRRRANDFGNKNRESYQEIIDSLPKRRQHAANVLETFDRYERGEITLEEGSSSRAVNANTANSNTSSEPYFGMLSEKDSYLFNNYGNLNKNELREKLRLEGNLYTPAPKKGEYYYDDGLVKNITSKDYFKENIAKAGQNHTFDAIGIVTDVLKNSEFTEEIRQGRLRTWRDLVNSNASNSTRNQYLALEHIAKILGNKKEDLTSEEIQSILKPYVDKLFDVNNPLQAQSIWYHIPEGARKSLIKGFTHKGSSWWNNHDEIDDSEINNWYNHLEGKLEKSNIIPLLNEKYKNAKALSGTPIFDPTDPTKSFRDIDKFLNSENAVSTLEDRSGIKSEKTISPELNLKTEEKPTFVRTNDITFTSTKNSSMIDTIARSSAENAQIRMSMDSNDLLAAINHNLTVSGQQMALTNELLVQGNIINSSKGGGFNYIPYQQPTTPTNTSPSSEQNIV